MVAYIAVVCLW